MTTQVEVTVDPTPLVLALSIVAALVALFVSAAQGDLYGAVLWYQSTKIWSIVSAVRPILPLCNLAAAILYILRVEV